MRPYTHHGGRPVRVVPPLNEDMGVFQFKQFAVSNERSALKVGTDGILLGAISTLYSTVCHILDIGTGTGVIALMLAQRMAEAGIPAQITGIDIDGPSAEEAAQNFAASPWASALSALHCSLSDFLAAGHGEFDLIVSNPPFFDDSLQNPDARESAARHTMSMSYRDICAAARDILAPEGTLSMILPAEVENELVRTTASFGLYLHRIVRIRTTERKPVKRIVAEFCKVRPASTQEEMLLLCDPSAPDGRTDAYRSLLRPYLVSVE